MIPADLGLVRKAVAARNGDLRHENRGSRFIDLVDRRVGELRATTRPVVRNVFFEKPARLAERFSCYWKSGTTPH